MPRPEPAHHGVRADQVQVPADEVEGYRRRVLRQPGRVRPEHVEHLPDQGNTVRIDLNGKKHCDREGDGIDGFVGVKMQPRIIEIRRIMLIE